MIQKITPTTIVQTVLSTDRKIFLFSPRRFPSLKLVHNAIEIDGAMYTKRLVVAELTALGWCPCLLAATKVDHLEWLVDNMAGKLILGPGWGLFSSENDVVLFKLFNE